MEVLDKFFKKYSYKFDKGYPDMNNEQDILLLENILNGLDIKVNLKETNLARSELKKYEDRVRLFVTQIQEKKPFETINGEIINITSIIDKDNEFDLNADVEEVVNSIISNKGTLFVKGDIDDKDVKISTNQLSKTKDYGGRGAGSGTRVEDACLADAVLGINKLDNCKPVSILFNGVTYNNIVTATTVPKMPKADFSFDDAEGNRKIFVSHKAGSTAKDFQQNGGVFDLQEYSEVTDFVEAVKEALPDSNIIEPGNKGYRRKVQSPEIIRRTVYGLDFEPKSNYGINNVQGLLQGPLTFDEIKGSKGEKVFKLESNHTILNPDLPEGDYECYFYVTMRKNRNQFGIKNARFGIYTEAFKRNATEI